MKRLVTQYHALNIKDLAKRSLYPFCRYDWVWWTHKGTQEKGVTITVREDARQLLYLMGAQRVQQAVRLTYTIGPRSGKRPWFVCPTCQRRVGMLYYVHPLPFRCRTCCDLAYPSQYQSRDRSYGRQLRELSRREQDRLLAPRAGGPDNFGRSGGKVDTRFAQGFRRVRPRRCTRLTRRIERQEAEIMKHGTLTGEQTWENR